MASEKTPFGSPVELEINGELDLHTFRPSELAPLLKDYIDECRGRGILSLRIIHGKGQGVQRERVHHLLEKMPARGVVSAGPAGSRRLGRDPGGTEAACRKSSFLG